MDPHAPAGDPDVLGTDETRLPPPYQRLFVAMTAAIVLLLVGAVQEVRSIHRDHRLDQAAISGVALVATLPHRIATNDTLELENDGTGPVTVLSAAFVGADFDTQRLHVTISPDGVAGVSPPGIKGCSPSLYFTGPDRLRVTVRTGRGDVVTRELELDGDLADQLRNQARWTCGLLLPSEALATQLVSMRRVGRDVEVTYHLTNNGRFRVTVESVEAPAGLTATAQLPLTVEGSDPAAPVTHVASLTMRLHVVSCPDFATGFFDWTDGRPAADVLHLQLDSEHASDDIALGINPTPSPEGDTSLVGYGLEVLQHECDPKLFPPIEPGVY